MKLFSPLATLAFFLLFLFSQAQLTAQCNGDVYISTQEAADNYAANYGCSVIEGNLILSGADIMDLSGLAMLTEILGTISINSAHNLTNLTGLENVTLVGEDIRIGFCAALTDISALSGVNGAVEDLWFQNSAIESLSGLSGITTVNSILIYGLPIENLDGLQNISLHSGESMHNYDFTTDFIDLPNLMDVSALTAWGQGVRLHELPLLESLSGLGGDSGILHISLDDVGSLSSIGTFGDEIELLTFRIVRTGLESLAGLEGLTVIDELIITNNENLTDASALVGLANYPTNLSVEDNINLSACCQFLEIIDLYGFFTFYNNAASCSGAVAIMNACTPGNSCNDESDCTTGDVIQDDFTCSGTLIDADGDGVYCGTDCDDNDETMMGVLGSPCDDGDPLTLNDVIVDGCNCAGEEFTCIGELDALPMERQGALFAGITEVPQDGSETYTWFNASNERVAQFTGTPYYSPTEVGNYYVVVKNPDYNCTQVVGPRLIETLDGCCEFENE